MSTKKKSKSPSKSPMIKSKSPMIKSKSPMIKSKSPMIKSKSPSKSLKSKAPKVKSKVKVILKDSSSSSSSSSSSPSSSFVSLSPAFSKIIVIAGPSGVGKSTIIKAMQEKIPNTFAFSVSHTTRQPRPGEVNGINYHFVTREVYDDLVSRNGFVEHAEVHGNCYGTSVQALNDVISKNMIAVLDIDLQGCKQIKQKTDIHPYFIRIKISEADLKKRLEGRGTETPETLAIRLQNAAKELEEMPGFFDYECENVDSRVCMEGILTKLTEANILPLGMSQKEGE